MSDSVYRGVLVFQNADGDLEYVKCNMYDSLSQAKAAATRQLNRQYNKDDRVWLYNPRLNYYYKDGVRVPFVHEYNNAFFVDRYVEQATEWTKV